jgi:exopolysaccharide biosynthesis WecB/TagA/CpsF family protein
VVSRCELVNADGQSIVWASRLLDDALPERVAGIDLMYALIAMAEREDYGIYILGARREVLDAAVQRLRQTHPRLRLSGTHDGYFTDDESPDVAAAIRDSGAQILFVAMSSPRKEHWIGEYGATLNVPFVMGVGGSIDIVAGITRRAPLRFPCLLSSMARTSLIVVYGGPPWPARRPPPSDIRAVPHNTTPKVRIAILRGRIPARVELIKP